MLWVSQVPHLGGKESLRASLESLEHNDIFVMLAVLRDNERFLRNYQWDLCQIERTNQFKKIIRKHLTSVYIDGRKMICQSGPKYYMMNTNDIRNHDEPDRKRTLKTIESAIHMSINFKRL